VVRASEVHWGFVFQCRVCGKELTINAKYGGEIPEVAVVVISRARVHYTGEVQPDFQRLSAEILVVCDSCESNFKAHIKILNSAEERGKGY